MLRRSATALHPSSLMRTPIVSDVRGQDVLSPPPKGKSACDTPLRRQPGAMTEDDSGRAMRLVSEVSELLGEGPVLLQIWSLPALERVFVGVENDSVVVSDNGETFNWISGHVGAGDGYLPWSASKATAAALRFGVQLLVDCEDGYPTFRLGRPIGSGESVAEVVQAVAMTIDGTLALHTPPGSPTYASYFWDRTDEQD